MAGLPGNTAYFAGAKQTAKGTAASVAKYKNAFSGGNIGPVRETDRLTETDSSRDQGAAYVTTSGVEGSPEFYVRSDSIGFYLAAALGGVTAPTGTTPNFVHTITPAQSLAYHTFWRNVGGGNGVLEVFQDCFVGSLSISAEAGAPLTATAGIQGRQASFLTVDPNAAVNLDNEQVFNFNNAAITLGGTATALVRSFEFGLENNVTRQQTDDVIPYDLSVGQREISLGFDMLFEDTTEYRKFHYGGAAGTVISPNIYTTSATLTFTIDPNTEISFNYPSLAYEEFPVEPDAGGDPIVVSARAVAQKAVGVTNLVTATVKNNVTTYVT